MKIDCSPWRPRSRTSAAPAPPPRSRCARPRAGTVLGTDQADAPIAIAPAIREPAAHVGRDEVLDEHPGRLVRGDHVHHDRQQLQRRDQQPGQGERDRALRSAHEQNAVPNTPTSTVGRVRPSIHNSGSRSRRNRRSARQRGLARPHGLVRDRETRPERATAVDETVIAAASRTRAPRSVHRTRRAAAARRRTTASVASATARHECARRT